MQPERAEILDYLVNTLILERLELADAGYCQDDFSEETAILDDDEMGLDSVDVLDILIGVEKKYKLQPIEINRNYIEEHCRSIADLIDMVQARRKAVA